jgi:hypothetical protein
VALKAPSIPPAGGDSHGCAGDDLFTVPDLDCQTIFTTLSGEIASGITESDQSLLPRRCDTGKLLSDFVPDDAVRVAIIEEKTRHLEQFATPALVPIVMNGKSVPMVPGARSGKV